MSDRLMWKTLWVTLAFFILSMSGMLVYANEKAVIITEGDHLDLTIPNDQRGQISGDKPSLQEPRSFVFDEDGKAGDRLCIPLAGGVKAEKVIVENRYMEEELRITILGGDVDFYNKRALYGDITGIEAGTYEASAIGVLMKFALDDIYECKSVLESGNLYIDLVPPAEAYDKIIVVAPMYGDSENTDAGTGDNAVQEQEKEIVLDIAKRLKKKLDTTDIKAYFTRLEDAQVLPQTSQELVGKVQADLFVALGTSYDAEDEKKYGTEVVYNADFFTPEINSVELADYCLREVVTQISGRANGLTAASENEKEIWNAEVPAAFLKVGYLSNAQEAALLAREDYREKIAEGIYRAILRLYEE